MEQFGEAIRGHHGEFVTKYYGKASESIVNEWFLKYTEIGKQDSCNQTLFLGGSEPDSYIWSTFSSEKGVTDIAGFYQHAVYQDNTVSNSYHVEQLVRFPFMNAEDCGGYLGSSDNFCAEIREENIHKRELEDKKTLPEINISKDLLACLAVYCVSKTRINSKKFLYVLVPDMEEDYQGYCQSVMIRLLNAIPAGLRKNISMATNPTKKNEGYFGILFRRDTGKEIDYSVRLNGEFKKDFLEEPYLTTDIKKLIGACANDFSIVSDCYRSLEQRYEDSGEISDEDYQDYYRLYELKIATFDCDLMKKLNEMLQKEQERQNAVSVIQSRLKSMEAVEEALMQNDGFEGEQSMRAVLSILGSYESLFHYLREEGMSFSHPFTQKVLERVTKDKDEKAMKDSCREIQKNEDCLKEYFNEQYIKEFIKELEEKKDNAICQRLSKEIWKKLNKASIDRAFIEAKGIGEDFKEKFGEYLCEGIVKAIDNKEIDEDKACALYLPINNYVKIKNSRYSEQAKACMKKKYIQEFENKPSAEVIKCGLDKLKQFDGWDYEELKEISECLYTIYSSKESEQELSGYHISEVIDILKENLWNGMMPGNLLKWYQDYRIRELELRVGDQPQENEIRELFLLLKETDSEKEEETAKNIYKWVSGYCEKTVFKQYQIKAMCKNIHSLRKMLNEQTSALNLKHEKENFEVIFCNCLKELLLECLTETVRMEPPDMKEVAEIFEYAKESLPDCEEFYKKACDTLTQIDDRRLEKKSAQEIRNIINKYGRYLGIYEKHHFAQDMSMDEVKQKKERFESYVKKLNSEKVVFSSFLKGMFLVEGERPLNLFIENHKQTIDFYMEEFAYFYKNKMCILLKKNCEVSDIDLQILLYKEFLKGCEENIVYFFVEKGKIPKVYSIDVVEDIWKTIYRLQNQFDLGEKEKESDYYSCLRLLLPYCKLTKENHKRLAQVYDSGELGKLGVKHCGIKNLIIGIMLLIFILLVAVSIFLLGNKLTHKDATRIDNLQKEILWETDVPIN